MRLINDVTHDTTHIQESEIKVIKLILLVHKKMSNSDVESSEESLKTIDFSDISDEEKELCSTLLSLQPYQFELELFRIMTS